MIEPDEIAKLGASLRRIDQKLLNPGKKGSLRLWFQGGEPYFDMFVELQENQIQWFQFTLRGHFVSWKQPQTTLQTGTTNELRTDDVTFYAASKLIDTDIKTDFDFIAIARSILQTRASEEIFAQILELFASKTSNSLSEQNH
jgi:hypothetical protein